MRRGIFFLIHDEIRGPEIKCSLYKNFVGLSKEFISKLYMFQANFEVRLKKFYYRLKKVFSFISLFCKSRIEHTPLF